MKDSLMRIFIPACLFFLISPAVQCANAQQQQNAAWCRGNETVLPDLRIGACTTLIQSGKESTRDLTADLIARAQAYLAKKQYDSALADVDQVIRIDPKDALAFYDRGSVDEEQKKYREAIADYSKAIEINPLPPSKEHHINVFRARGLIHFRLQELDLALADYNQAILIDATYATPY